MPSSNNLELLCILIILIIMFNRTKNKSIDVWRFFYISIYLIAGLICPGQHIVYASQVDEVVEIKPCPRGHEERSHGPPSGPS